MRYYPAEILPDSEGGFYAHFIYDHHDTETELSGVVCGATFEDTQAELEELLIGIVESYFKNDKPFPAPRALKQGQSPVLMPTLVEAKVLLHNERLKRKLSKTDLGKLAGFSPAEMQRLLNPWYKSGIDKLDRLFKALDLTLSINLA